MRRITFFVGNGFDINIGLLTKYKQFYEYFITQYPEDMLAKDIDSDYEYWADMEEGLGKYTSKIDNENEELFWNSEELLEQALADYLEIQTRNVSIDVKKSANILKDSLVKFYEDLPKEQHQDISNLIHNIKDTVTYSFISLNYTNMLDLCVDAGKTEFPKEIASHKADNGTTYSHNIGEIIHIHGTINEELVLGVNDESQILNETFGKNIFYRQLLIKEEVNKRFGQNKVQDARRIIDSSAIICIFGASIGATDKMWWKYICKWLQKSLNNRLIIYAKYDNPQPRTTKYILFAGENKIFQRLKDNSELNNEEWNKIQNQIYIKFESKIFGFEIMRDEEDFS